MPSISVILPCYNVERWVGRCLDSLLRQTLPGLEIICVDDKSTDNTLKIMRDIAKANPRVRVIALPENQGAAVARNAGLDVATGRYIGFVDPDDFVAPDFFEQLYTVAKKKDADIVKGNVLIINQQTNQTFMTEEMQNIKRHIGYFCVCFWSAIYRRQLIQDNNIRFPDDVRTSQDAVFLTHATLATRNIAVVETAFYYYSFRRQDALDSQNLSHAKAQSKVRALKMCLELIRQAKLSPKEFTLFVSGHVLMKIKYEIKKSFEDESDRHAFFELLLDMYAQENTREVLRQKFSPDAYQCIAQNDYNGFLRIYKRSAKRLYFLKIPIARIDNIAFDKYVKLFEYLPLYKVTPDHRVYLFNFILLPKLRG